VPPTGELDAPREDRRVRWASRGVLLVDLAWLAWAVLPGIDWGLPSEERNELTLGPDRSRWRAPKLGTGEADDPWAAYPNYLPGGPERKGALPRSAFNPLRTYHPDEYVVLKSLSAMRPAQGRLFHGFFGWPALQFYVVGAALKLAGAAGLVELTPDTDYYFRHPEAMAALYRTGRLVTLLFAIGCVVALWAGAGRLLGSLGGAAAAVLLAAMPLFVVNAHWMTGDVPMLFWLLLAFYAAVRIFQDGPERWYLWGGAFIGLAAATRYQGGLASWLIFAAHLMRPWQPEERRSLGGYLCGRLRPGPLWLAAMISVSLFLATNPYVFARPGQFARELAGEFSSAGTGGGFISGLPRFIVAGTGSVMAVVLAGALLMAAVRREREPVFLLIAFGPPAAFLLAGRPTMLRYLMPVAPACPFLIAWALARLHREGLARKRKGAWAAAPLLLLVTAGLTALQTGLYCRLFTDPEADTRTRAGEWIARRVPAGSSIGIAAKPDEPDSTPWQFELPPLDDRRCRIVILRPWHDEWRDSPPDCIVASDLQFPPLATRDALGPTEEAFRREIFHGGKQYAVVARFEAWPVGMKYLLYSGPQDMRYLNPVIVVARRRKD